MPFGPENGDLEVAPGFLTSGQTIDLHLFFPFYGGLYNYTTVNLLESWVKFNSSIEDLREWLFGLCHCA